MGELQIGLLSIEKMREEDIAGILELQRRTNLEFWSEQSYREVLGNKDYLCLVAQIENAVIGFINVRLIMPEIIAEIINIGVTAEFQGKGIGRKLFEETVKWCGANNLEAIFLEVRTSNHNAVRFYERNDFRVVGERKNFYRNPSENALLMRLDLKKLD